MTPTDPASPVAHRRGEADVTVLGADGEPLANTEVVIEQTRHEFAFGCIGFDLIDHANGAADERQARRVLVLARSLSDEHQRRVRVAGAEDGVRPALREVAAGADRHLFGKLLQPPVAVLAAIRRIKETVQGSSGYLVDLLLSFYNAS